MKVIILKTTVSPEEKRTPRILRKGAAIEIDDAVAEKLIAADKAKVFDEEVKSTTPSNDWTVTDLKKYAEDNKIDLTGATKKDQILEAVLKAIAASQPTV